jgi:predicted PurR-regulated permease PerM
MATLRQLKDRSGNAIVAGLIVIALLLICAGVLWHFVNAFFVALAGYVFLNPFYLSFRKRGFGKTASAWLTLIFGAVLIIFPTIYIAKVVLNETVQLLSPSNLSASVAALTANAEALSHYLPGVTIPAGSINSAITQAVFESANYVRALLAGWLAGAGMLALDLLIIVFGFYYLLVAEDALGYIRSLIPFSRKNTDILIAESKKVLYSSIIVTGLMALIQAVPLTLVFIYFNVPAAAFLGFLAAVLTCIPFTGIPVVWIPVALLEALSGNYAAAAGITVAGIIIAIIENFRPVLQNRIGEIHPLISLLGVIIGVVYFGILGLLIGPILLSITLLTAHMFKEEYL